MVSEQFVTTTEQAASKLIGQFVYKRGKVVGVIVDVGIKDGQVVLVAERISTTPAYSGICRRTVSV